jgi:DNA-binding MarR family transcriptional regulator
MVVSADDFERLARARIDAEVPGVDMEVFRALFGLSRVTSRLSADFDSVVQRPRGLSWAGFRTLFCLWVAGPLLTGDLAHLLFTTAPSVSSAVNTLEGRGWVRRARLDRDRRLVEVRLTASGSRLIRSVFREQHEREVAWAAEVPPDDWAAFIRVMEHLATRHRPETPSPARRPRSRRGPASDGRARARRPSAARPRTPTSS